MKINPYIFRAYDIRGAYPRDLNGKTAFRIASAFAWLYPKAKKIVVGYDARESSPFLAKAVITALTDSGRTVIDLKTASDPIFYFAIFRYEFDAGIMISGSHLSEKDNGLSLCVKVPGKDTTGAVGAISGDLKTIKSLVLGKSRLIPAKGKNGKVVCFDTAKATKDYVDFVSKKIHLAKPLKIIIDSSFAVPKMAFEKLGCRVKTIVRKANCLLDPYLTESQKDLKRELKKGKFDLGFIYDSDGDRMAAIDSLGRQVSGDDCLLLFARQALKKAKNLKGSVVHDARVSRAFLDEMQRRGVKTYFSVSHHSAVMEKIKEVKAVFGGEVTLHFFFPLEYYLADDAVFASLKLAEIAAREKDFPGLIDSLPRYFASPEIFLPCPDEKKFKIIKNLQDYLQKNKYDFVDIDGARINFPHGWALARAANTSPFIKCRFEADTKERLKEIENQALAIFAKVGIPVTHKIYRDFGIDKN